MCTPFPAMPADPVSLSLLVDFGFDHSSAAHVSGLRRTRSDDDSLPPPNGGNNTFYETEDLPGDIKTHVLHLFVGSTTTSQPSSFCDYGGGRQIYVHQVYLLPRKRKQNILKSLVEKHFRILSMGVFFSYRHNTSVRTPFGRTQHEPVGFREKRLPPPRRPGGTPTVADTVTSTGLGDGVSTAVTDQDPPAPDAVRAGPSVATDISRILP